jgi:hypothetical protein
MIPKPMERMKNYGPRRFCTKTSQAAFNYYCTMEAIYLMEVGFLEALANLTTFSTLYILCQFCM